MVADTMVAIGVKLHTVVVDIGLGKLVNENCRMLEMHYKENKNEIPLVTSKPICPFVPLSSPVP